MQAPDPVRLEKLKLREQRMQQSLRTILRQEPESDAEATEFESAIREKRANLANIAAEWARFENASQARISIPTADEIQTRMADVANVLLKVANEGTPEEIDELRELLRKLTGGRIAR